VRTTGRPGTRRDRLSVLGGLVVASVVLAGCGGTAGHGSATAGTPANPRPAPVEVTGRILRPVRVDGSSGTITVLEAAATTAGSC
jgi:hypothetical protein